MQAMALIFRGSSLKKLVSVYASSTDSPLTEDATVDAVYGETRRLSPKGRKRRGIRARRVRVAKEAASRAALLRAADTRRTALGLAAVDAVPVLAGHGPQAVALDVTRLLARACAGTLQIGRSLCLLKSSA